MKIFVLIILIFPLISEAKHSRSAAAKHDFQRQQPCPSTGKQNGKCPGYIIDHRHALCVGGADRPENMRWMTVEAAKAKDRWECKPGWEDRLKECEANGCFIE